MTDRELLELAAKAAGYGEVWYLEGYETPYIGPKYTVGATPQYKTFNPLTDDGDALRLAVYLRMDIRFYPDGETPWVETATDSSDADEALTIDPLAATRRAIVRAAAEIGKGMKQPS